jgi:hypothetical protein
MTPSTATPLRSPSAELIMRASAKIPFCATAFEESLAPAGVIQARSAAMAKGTAMRVAEREMCRIGDEKGNGGPVNIENKDRAVGGKREDMGEKRRAVFAARQLKRSAKVTLGPIRPRRFAREGVQPLVECLGCGRKPPALVT